MKRIINWLIVLAVIFGTMQNRGQLNGKPIFSGTPAKLDIKNNRVGIPSSDACTVQTSREGKLQVNCSKKSFPHVSFKIGLSAHKPWLVYSNYIGSIIGPTIPGKKVVRRTIYCEGSVCEHAK